MFGFFRLALAWEVVAYHLSGRHPVGWYSVYAFYALSGYLMTLVITKKYPLNRDGGLNFLLNRALRIYPPYLAMAAAAFALLSVPALYPISQRLATTPPMGLPTGASSWFSDLFILGWHMPVPKLVPQVWSVYREIFYCSAIFFCLGRDRRVALGWFAVSAGYIVYTLARGYHLFDVYNSFLTASFSYSAGSCLYHFRKQLDALRRPLVPQIILAAALPFALEAVRPRFFGEDSPVPFYLNNLFSVYMVLLLSGLKTTPKSYAFDQYVGNLAYPLYLCHFNVGILVAAALGWTGLASDRMFLACLLPVSAGAWLVNRYMERTIGYGYDKRRQERRQAGRAAAGALAGAPAALAPAPASGAATVIPSLPIPDGK
jgi:peptidoglycan/LPS O-acetylase OafA/YrhL